MKYIIIKFIRLYQITISPLLPSSCRYIPTCSQYAMESIQRFNVIKGSWIAFKRIIRCHPWGNYGYDPVPHHKNGEHQ